MARPCKVEDCNYPKTTGKHFCRWHWLLRQPADRRVMEAERAFANRHNEEIVARVPERLWPPGERWCAGCQRFVPLFYTTGSRCKGCASKASHSGHLERTYGLSRADYEALLAYQGGRCAICGQLPGTRRLAVDHDHRTGEVRGLLCASDQHGCNARLAPLLNDIEMARRALAYVERSPWQKLLDLRAAATGERPE